jgi:hypothetical protein
LNLARKRYKIDRMERLNDTLPSRSPALERLEEEIEFYDKSAVRKRRFWRALATTELVAAASVPAAAALGGSTGLLGMLGAVVVICQGILGLFQSQSRYLAHRRTYERLKSERALYRAQAGPYRSREDPEVLLAERVEDIRQEETDSWLDEERRAARAKRPDQVESGEGS